MRILASLRAALVLEIALSACVAGCVASFPGDTSDAAAEATDGSTSSGNLDALAGDGDAQGSLADGRPDAPTESGSGDGATSDGSVDASVSDAGGSLPDAGDSGSVETGLASCATNHGGCDPNATCAVVDGGITCACASGYSGDGNSCTSVDACKTNNGGCDPNAACTSTGPGTNSCACNTGYTGNGTTCTGVGSCAVNNGGCASTAQCTSTSTGTTCACNSGYSGNGETCTAVNSCQTNNGGCDMNATCTSTGPGTNTCACKTGYSGTGTTCTAVNPCETNNGGCATGATCAMTGPGTNSCACPSGESVCSGACINEINNSTPNATNCGGCGSGYTCTGGQICQGGSCACSAGTIACTGSCPTSGVSCIKVTEIAAGFGQACALLSTGAVECWGSNWAGQLGQGSAGSDSLYPVVVSGVTNATAITAGGDHSCALSGPSWECWGENDSGEIGSIGSAICDSQPCTLTPTRIISNASAFSTGYSDTCMVVSGQVECLGDSTFSVIGTTYGPDSCRGGTNNCAVTPQTIYSDLLTGVSQVSSYNTAACAIVSGGGVVCWGEEGTGEIGPSGTSFTCGGDDLCSSPVAIPGIANAVALAGGQWFVCALISNQTVECWGSNQYGQLGSTETATCEETFPYACSTTPSVVSNLSGVTQIAAGADFACALLQNGTVQCWGNNAYDGLGNSSVTGSCQGSYNVCSSSPVPVSGVSGATAITAGSDFGCALTQSGQVLCWGYNAFGQLGNGTNVASLTALPVQF